MSVAHEFQERAVDTRIVAQFGMERRSHGFPLPDDYGIISFRGDYFDARAEALDLRCADENHFDRLAVHQPRANRAVALTPVGVTADRDIKRVESRLRWVRDFLRQEYGARTRTECWLHADKLFQLRKPSTAQDLQERARLAAWNYEPIDLVELLWLSNLDNLRAELFEPLTVRVEISLNCQNANFHGTLKIHNSRRWRLLDVTTLAFAAYWLRRCQTPQGPSLRLAGLR